MTFFILNTLKLLIKLTLIILLSNLDILVLVCLNLCLCILIYYLIQPYKFKDNEFIEILKCYHIKNKVSLNFSIFCIILYILVFIFGILYLRIYNYNTKIFVLKIVNDIFAKISPLSIYLIILNIILVFFILIIYILLFAKIIKYFITHFVKIHLFIMAIPKYEKFYIKLLWRIRNYAPDTLSAHKCIPIYEFIFGKIPEDGPTYIKEIFYIEKILSIVLNYGHYFITIIIILYDLFYGNYTLNYLFKILPYIFIYDIYKRITNYISYLDYVDDLSMAGFMYKPHVFLTNYEVIINGDNTSIETLQLYFSVIIYLKSNLDGYAWCYPRMKLNGELVSLKEYLGKSGAYDIPKDYKTVYSI